MIRGSHINLYLLAIDRDNPDEAMHWKKSWKPFEKGAYHEKCPNKTYQEISHV